MLLGAFVWIILSFGFQVLCSNVGPCNGSCADYDVSENCCGPTQQPCSPGFECVRGNCTCIYKICNSTVCTTLQEPSNCGACGVECPPAPGNATATCVNSTCGFACNMGFADCNSTPGCETNILTNATNCGLCGRVCSPSQNGRPACVNGNCTFNCNPGFDDCDLNGGNGCETDILNDPLDCGVCGFVCGGGPNALPQCVNGTCTFLCSSGFKNCTNDPGCETNISNDVNNCGDCGTICPTLINAVAGCSSGLCNFTCNAGFGDCDPIIDGCEAPLNTTENCGSCSNTCALGETCCNGNCTNTDLDELNCGQCGLACPEGSTCCNGSCVDTTSSNTNCAGCGNTCDVNEVCCNGSCVNLQNSTVACGNCSNSCSIGFNCCSGSCKQGPCSCPPDQIECNFQCVPLGNDFCGSCTNSCSSPTTCCLNTLSCVDLNSDSLNCGSCGLECSIGFGCCNGNCTNLNTTMNCATCGNACLDPPNAVAFCNGTDCDFTCNVGFDNCNQTSPGCETDLMDDLLNCGQCGLVCPIVLPNGTPDCSQGVCTVICDVGFANCDGILENGCEVNTANDPLNCQACSVQCDTPPFSNATCTNSTCGFVCLEGYGDCNSDLGCETNLNTNSSNCNACGIQCPFGVNSQPTCNNGICGLICDAGFANCNNIPEDGCETDITSSTSNCGQCNAVCQIYPNVIRTCVNGVCQYDCAPGFLNCNGIITDGCEVPPGLICCGTEPCPVSISWGRNTDGQLASGTQENTVRFTPAAIVGTLDFIFLDTAQSNGFGITSDLKIYSWGNAIPLLGQGPVINDVLVPTEVTTPNNTQFDRIACGSVCLAIDVSGNLWVWGQSSSGALGDGSTVGTRDVPFQLTVLDGGNPVQFKRVASGSGFSMAVDSNGNYWGWGANPNGQLGTGSTQAIFSTVPVIIGTGYADVQAGLAHSVGLKTDGTIVSWGRNQRGALGIGSNDFNLVVTTPTDITPSGSLVKEIYTAFDNNCVIMMDNRVFCWGANSEGQTCTGTTSSGVISPTAWAPLPENIVGMALGTDATLALATSGKLYTCGSNGNGLMTISGPIRYLLPTLSTLDYPLRTEPVSIAAGATFALAIRAV